MPKRKAAITISNLIEMLGNYAGYMTYGVEHSALDFDVSEMVDYLESVAVEAGEKATFVMGFRHGRTDAMEQMAEDV